MNGESEKRKRTLAIGAAALIASIAVWEFIATVIVKDPFILPGFIDVVEAFFNLLQRGTLGMDLAVSFLHFGIGMGFAILLGVPIGICMGWFPRVNAALNPIIEILRPIPPLAWIPFAIIWFGLTHQSAGFVVFVGGIFPVLVNTYTGFQGVPRIYVETANVLGCTSSLRVIRKIAFPSAIPSIAAGIRVAMGVAWMCLVAAEMFGVSKYGLGHKLWQFYNLHQMPNVVVYMVLLGLIGLGIDMIFRYYVDKKLLKWRLGEVRS